MTDQSHTVLGRAARARELTNGILPRLRRRAAGQVAAIARGVSWDRLDRPARVVHAGLAVVAIALVIMATIDKPVVLYLKAVVTGDTMALWQTISKLGDATPYVILALAVLGAARYLQRCAAHVSTMRVLGKVQRYCVLLLASLALSGAILNLAKIAIGRLRPRFLFEETVAGFRPFNLDTGDNSFPSGHSQVIWVLAAVLCMAFPRHALAFITLATTVALSRVIITVHFPSDVLVGSYLGIASVLLLAPVVWRYTTPQAAWDDLRHGLRARAGGRA
jgi:membrane-associated phospholipid phosphatase